MTADQVPNTISKVYVAMIRIHMMTVMAEVTPTTHRRPNWCSVAPVLTLYRSPRFMMEEEEEEVDKWGDL